MIHKKALGIDPGDARFGVAISDDLGMLAHPLETIDAKQRDPVPRIRQLVKDHAVATLVLGLPKNMDGSLGAAAEKTKVLEAKLRTALPDVQVVLIDERLTTVMASRALSDAGHNAKQQKKKIDQAAAQTILQTWLDSQSLADAPLLPPP